MASLLSTGMLACACGDDEKDGILDSNGTFVLVGVDPHSDMGGAGFQGTVAVVGHCLGVDQRTVIWPKGTTVASNDPLAIRVPGHNGVIRVGDRIGGGSIDLGSDLPNGIPPIPKSCPTDEVVGLFPSRN